MGIIVSGLRNVSGKLTFRTGDAGTFSFLTAPGSLGTQFDGVQTSVQLTTNAPVGQSVFFSLAFGTLPPGMILNAVTGEITGAANFVADFTTYYFTIAATWAGQTATRQFNFSIKPNFAPVWTTTGITDALDQVFYTFQLRATDANSGQPLTFSLNSGSLPAGLTLSPEGVISGVAEAISSATETKNLTFAVSDGMKSVNKQFQMMVRRNVEPVWVTGTNIGEGLGNSYFAVPIVASDANGTSLVYSADEALPLPTGLSIAPNGTVFGILPPALTENQTITFGAKATDGPHTISKTFTVTALVNVNPVFTVSPMIEAIAGIPVSHNLTAIDPLNQSAITYTVIGEIPSGMSFSDGILSGNPANVTEATDFTFSVEASNGELSTVQDFTFRVAPDLAPVWETESGEIVRSVSGLTVSYQLLAADPNGRPLTFEVQSGTLPTGLSLSSTGLIAGELSMVAEDTTRTFIIRASDGTKFADREFSIFHGQNTAPVWITPGALGSAAGGTTMQYVVAAFDAEGYPLTYRSKGNTDGVSFDPATRTLTFELKQLQKDAFVSKVLEVTDGVHEVTRSFSVLNKFSLAPVITTAVVSKAIEQTPYTFQIQAQNPGNNGFMFEVVAGALPPGLSLNASTGVISGTPGANASDENFTFTIRLTNEISSVEREFTVLVEHNIAPVWQTAAGSLGETLANNEVEYNLEVSDPNGTPPIVTAFTPLPTGLTLSGTTISGKLAVVEEDTTHEFTLRASDGVANSDRTFSVTVFANNDPVWVTSADLGSRPEDTNTSISIVATDPERMPVTLSLVAGAIPAGMSLTGGSLVGRTPVVEETTVYTFTISASDGVKTIEREFTLSVENNFAPVWTTAEGSLGEVLSGYGDYSFQVQATDPNGSTVLYSIVSGSIPQGMTFQAASGRIYNVGHSTVALANSDEVYTFTVRATDGKLFTDRDFSITVLKNDTPVWITPAGLILTADAGSNISIQLEATDAEERTLEYAFQGSGYPTGVTLSETGILSGTLPTVAQDTTYTFNVVVTDGARTSVRQFQIISQFSSAPIWQTPTALEQGREGSEVYIQLSARAGAQEVSYTAVSGLPESMTLSSNGLLTGTRPLVTGNTNLSIVIRATAIGGSTDRTFTMTVLDNISPVWVTPEGQIGSGMEGDAFSFTLQATDEDDTPTYVLADGDLGGLTLNEATGEISGALPIVDEITDFSFTIGAFDGSVRVDRVFSIKVRKSLSFVFNGVITTPAAPTTASYEIGESEGSGDWRNYDGTGDRSVNSAVPTTATFQYTRDFSANPLFSNSTVATVTTPTAPASATGEIS